MNCPWAEFSPATIEFCEERLCGWIAEPSNTWSNLAYLVAGIAVLRALRWRVGQPLAAIGFAAICVGLGSFFFHASGTRIGEVVDVAAMYLISGLFITFAVHRLWQWSSRNLMVLYVGLVTASTLILIAVGDSGIPMFVLQVTIAVLLEGHLFRRHVWGTVDYRPQWLLIAFFAVSFVAWALDLNRIVCWRDNHILSGHAVWHLSNSTCFWFFYVFQRQFAAGTQAARESVA